MTSETNLRRTTAPRVRPVRDLAADWKRWTLAERIAAVALFWLVLLAALAASAGLLRAG
jgi:hypothetical protein